MRKALKGDDRGEILRLAGLLDAYNNSDELVAIAEPVPPADPQKAQEVADIKIADCKL